MAEFPIVTKLGGRDAVLAKLRAAGWERGRDAIRMWAAPKRARIPGSAVIILLGLAKDEGIAVEPCDLKLAGDGSCKAA